MTRECKRQAMIGPSMKLEMKKRHRTGTMGTAGRQRTQDVRWSVDTHCRWQFVEFSFWNDLVTAFDEANK